MPIPEEKLSEWTRLAEEATEGPWAIGSQATNQHLICFTQIAPSLTVAHPVTDKNNNLDFICASRTALPLLLDEVRKLRAIAVEAKKIDWGNSSKEMDKAIADWERHD